MNKAAQTMMAREAKKIIDHPLNQNLKEPQPQSTKRRKRYDSRQVQRRILKVLTGMDTRLRELRQEIVALRKDVQPLWHWHGDAGWKPADPLAERIEQIEQRLSVERGIP